MNVVKKTPCAQCECDQLRNESLHEPNVQKFDAYMDSWWEDEVEAKQSRRHSLHSDEVIWVGESPTRLKRVLRVKWLLANKRRDTAFSRLLTRDWSISLKRTRGKSWGQDTSEEFSL